MAWPENLSAANQALIQNWVDQEFRPATLLLVRALVNASVGTVPSYIASQTGLTSTFASPAADSIAGLLATLNSADVIPISVTAATGYALALPITVGNVITYMGGFNTMVTTYYVSAAIQAWSNIVGAPNL